MATQTEAGKQVAQILKRHSARLVRTKRHNVWKFPDGKTFVTAQSPSDVHAEANQLRDLKSLLHLNPETRGAPGERRAKKDKPGIARPVKITPGTGGVLSTKLLEAGLVKDLLEAKLATARIELTEARRANRRKKRQLADIQRHCCICWGCRLRRWWRRFRRGE